MTLLASSRYLPNSGLSDGLMTAAVEVSRRYLPPRGLSYAFVEVSSGYLTCHVGVLATAL